MKTKHLVSLLILILSILLCWSLARFTWLLASIVTEPPPVLDSASPALATPPTLFISDEVMSGIKAANVFGQLTMKEQVRSAPVKVKPVNSPLNMKLLGVIFSGDVAHRVALIAVNGEQRAYSKKDVITVGREKVTLTEIFVDRIVVDRQGFEEVVALNKRNHNDSNGITQSISSGVVKVDFNDRKFRQLLGNVRKTVRTEPYKLSKYFDIKPVRSGGALQGYKLNSGRDKRLFAALPFKSNDLVTAVNGESVGALSLASIMQLVEKKTEFDVTVLRDDEQLSFTVLF